MNTPTRFAPLRASVLLLILVLAGWGVVETLNAPPPAAVPGRAQHALLVGAAAAAPLAWPVLNALWRSARE